MSDIPAFRNVKFETIMEHRQSLGSLNSPGTVLTKLIGLFSVCALRKVIVDDKKKREKTQISKMSNERGDIKTDTT